MAEEASFEVSAEVQFSGSGQSGSGKMVKISRKGVQIEAPEAVKAETNMSIAFRFFDTSTPIHVPVKVTESSTGGFYTEFMDLQVVTKNMLRMMLSKLKQVPADQRSPIALLRPPV